MAEEGPLYLRRGREGVDFGPNGRMKEKDGGRHVRQDPFGLLNSFLAGFIQVPGRNGIFDFRKPFFQGRNGGLGVPQGAGLQVGRMVGVGDPAVAPQGSVDPISVLP